MSVTPNLNVCNKFKFGIIQYPPQIDCYSQMVSIVSTLPIIGTMKAIKTAGTVIKQDIC